MTDKPSEPDYRIERRNGDFYETNRGEAVNLFARDGTIFSGEIFSYDPVREVVVLNHCIQRVYNEDGTSKFEEILGFEIDTPVISMRARTTEKDRKGRLIKYNQDLERKNREESGKKGKSKN